MLFAINTMAAIATGGVWGDVAGSFAAVVPLVAAIVAVCWVRPTRGRREKRRRRSRETSNLNLDGTGSWNEEKTSHVSLKYGGLAHFLAGQRAREDPDEKEMARHNRAVKRGWSSWGKDWEDWKRRNGIEAGDGIHKVHGRMSLMFREDFTYSKFPGFEKDRKYAIRFVYLSFGWPAEENWLGWEQVSTGYKRSLPIVICRQLNIPESSVESVKKIMRDIDPQMNLGYTEYDPSENRRINCGKPLIEDMSKDALCVYRQIEVGQSLGNVTCTLNKRRRRNGRPPVSYGAVQRFVKESEVISRQKRQTQKSGGKEDWVQARFVLFSQVLRQLKKAERIEAGGEDYVPEEDGSDEEQAELERPIYLPWLMVADEVRFSVVLTVPANSLTGFCFSEAQEVQAGARVGVRGKVQKRQRRELRNWR